MSTKQNTVYIVRPGNTLQVLLAETDEPARDLAFMSRREAEEYASECVCRARLFKVYRDGEGFSDDEIAEDVDWSLNGVGLRFRSGRVTTLATFDTVPLGA